MNSVNKNPPNTGVRGVWSLVIYRIVTELKWVEERLHNGSQSCIRVMPVFVRGKHDSDVGVSQSDRSNAWNVLDVSAQSPKATKHRMAGVTRFWWPAIGQALAITLNLCLNDLANRIVKKECQHTAIKIESHDINSDVVY